MVFWNIVFFIVNFAIAVGAIVAAAKKPNDKNFLSPSMAVLVFVLFGAYACIDLAFCWNVKFFETEYVLLELTWWIRPLISWLGCYLWMEISSPNPTCHKTLLGVTIAYFLFDVILNSIEVSKGIYSSFL